MRKRVKCLYNSKKKKHEMAARGTVGGQTNVYTKISGFFFFVNNVVWMKIRGYSLADVYIYISFILKSHIFGIVVGF